MVNDTVYILLVFLTLPQAFCDDTAMPRDNVTWYGGATWYGNATQDGNVTRRSHALFDYVYCKDKDNNDTELHDYDTMGDWIHNTIFLEPVFSVPCNATWTPSREDDLFLRAHDDDEDTTHVRDGKQFRGRRRGNRRRNFCRTKQNVVCPIAKIKCGVCSFFVPGVLCGAFCLKVNTLCELAALTC